MNTPKFIKLTYKYEKYADPSPHIKNVEIVERWFNVNNILVVTKSSYNAGYANTEILVEGGTHYVTETPEEILALIEEAYK